MGLALWNLDFKNYCIASLKLYILNASLVHLFIFQTIYLLMPVLFLLLAHMIAIQPEPLLIWIQISLVLVFINTGELGLLMYFNITFFYLEKLFPKNFFVLFKLNTRSTALKTFLSVGVAALCGSGIDGAIGNMNNAQAAHDYVTACTNANIVPDSKSIQEIIQQPTIFRENAKTILDYGFAASKEFK